MCCVRYGRGGLCSNSLPRQKKWQFTKMTRHIVMGEGGGQAGVLDAEGAFSSLKLQ